VIRRAEAASTDNASSATSSAEGKREFGGGGSIEIIDIRAGRHVIEGEFWGTAIVVTDS